MGARKNRARTRKGRERGRKHAGPRKSAPENEGCKERCKEGCREVCKEGSRDVCKKVCKEVCRAVCIEAVLIQSRASLPRRVMCLPTAAAAIFLPSPLPPSYLCLLPTFASFRLLLQAAASHKALATLPLTLYTRNAFITWSWSPWISRHLLPAPWPPFVPSEVCVCVCVCVSAWVCVRLRQLQ